MKKILSSQEETGEFAKDLLEKMKEKPKKDGASVIALEGELGSGKTVFAKALAEELGTKKRITSPTFLIMRKYPVPEGKFKTLFHIDAYRINEHDLSGLGFGEIIKDPENIIVVEWADRVKGLVPPDSLWIGFAHGEKENERIATVK